MSFTNYLIDVAADWKAAEIYRRTFSDTGTKYQLQEPMIGFLRRWMENTHRPKDSGPFSYAHIGFTCLAEDDALLPGEKVPVPSFIVLHRKTGGAESGFWWEVLTKDEKFGELSFCPDAKELLGISPQTRRVTLALTDSSFTLEATAMQEAVEV